MKYVIKFMFIAILFAPLITHATKIEPPVVFDGVGNEKIRKCPSFDCEVIKYGGYFTFVEVSESSGDWYKVRYTERSSSYANRNNPLIPYQEYVPIELPKSQWTTTVGWIYYSLVPEKILMEIKGSSTKIEKKKEEVIGMAILKRTGTIFNCPSTNGCTLLEKLDEGVSVEVVEIDKTEMWYKIKLDDPILLDWEKWMQASDFVDKPKKSTIRVDSKASTSSSSSSHSSLPREKDLYLDLVYGSVELLWNKFIEVVEFLNPISIFR